MCEILEYGKKGMKSNKCLRHLSFIEMSAGAYPPATGEAAILDHVSAVAGKRVRTSISMEELNIKNIDRHEAFVFWFRGQDIPAAVL